MKTPAANFKSDAARVATDLRHRRLIQTALGKYEVARDAKKSAFQDWQAARQFAAETKWEAINHLDAYLEAFVAKLEAHGTKVHWASTGEQAREIILGIIQQKKARSIIKSKAMTAEEIHLNEALEKAGLEVVESDLGEFIVQLRHEPPYHIVFPAMHLTRGEISELFQRELGSAPTDSPEELTMIARRALRKKYLTADVGITGANFAIAETGMVSITENEGNARLTAARGRRRIGGRSGVADRQHEQPLPFQYRREEVYERLVKGRPGAPLRHRRWPYREQDRKAGGVAGVRNHEGVLMDEVNLWKEM